MNARLSSIVSSLSAEQIRIVCFAINDFGAGQHAYAEAQNVHFFMRDYVLECLAFAHPFAHTAVKEQIDAIVAIVEGAS